MSALRFGTFGLTWLGLRHWRPSFERWGHHGHGGAFWHVSALGLSLWRDTVRPLTVGERGAW